MVVGGGTAGCIVAGRLAVESGAEVVLLEAGPDYGPREGGAWPADLLDGGALAASHSWGYASGGLYPERAAPLEFPRARVLGGCSSHNGCIVAAGCSADYDGWAAHAGDTGWRAAAVRPLIARALERLRVRHYAPEEIGPFHRACLEAAEQLGLPRADDLDSLDGGTGFGTEPVNVEAGVRINAAFAYLDPARARPNLRIVPDALCDRVLPGRRGVEAFARLGREELRISAATAVLAAGSYGTPAILLRSGIGEPEELRRLGIEPLHPLPGVGRNLHDHPLVELDFAGTEELRRLLREAGARGFVPEEQTLGKARSSFASGPYDLHVIPVAAPERSLLSGRTLIAAAALEPRSRGRLTLRSADPETPPFLDHGYLSDPEGSDLAVLLEGVELARALAATAPLRELIGPELEVEGTLEQQIRCTHGHYFHPVGTCSMGGGEDRLAVCDGRGRLHGLERIVVADCSLMPAVPRANTNLPAVVVAEKVTNDLLSLDVRAERCRGEDSNL